MSVLDGPGEGTWSVFAMKVVEERDELRYKLAGEAAHIKSLEGLLVDAVRERDAARAELQKTRDDFSESRRDFVRVADALGLVSTDDTGRIGQVASVDEVVAVARSIESLRAEVDMLRGVGCREAKEGEIESGPCGVCLRCAEERGAKWALDAIQWGHRDDRWHVAERVCREERGKR